MPLDKVLLNHLDMQDELEDSIDKDVEAIVAQIDIDSVIDDPQSVLLAAVNMLQEKLKAEYYPKAAQNGIELAKDIKKDGDIKVQDSDNPELNEGALDD